MAKASRKKTTSTAYRSVGSTYDGVRVIAPKTKSKTFTPTEVRKAIQKALKDAGVEPATKPLRDTDAVRVKQRADGRFEVRKKDAKRASAITDTQAEAIAKAKQLSPEKATIAKRVRKSPAGKKGTWRET